MFSPLPTFHLQAGLVLPHHFSGRGKGWSGLIVRNPYFVLMFLPSSNSIPSFFGRLQQLVFIYLFSSFQNFIDMASAFFVFTFFPSFPFLISYFLYSFGCIPFKFFCCCFSSVLVGRSDKYGIKTTEWRSPLQYDLTIILIKEKISTLPLRIK